MPKTVRGYGNPRIFFQSLIKSTDLFDITDGAIIFGVESRDIEDLIGKARFSDLFMFLQNKD